MDTSPKMDIRKEVRFAVVICGRASLATHIDNLAQKLPNTVRAKATEDCHVTIFRTRPGT